MIDLVILLRITCKKFNFSLNLSYVETILFTRNREKRKDNRWTTQIMGAEAIVCCGTTVYVDVCLSANVAKLSVHVNLKYGLPLR